MSANKFLLIDGNNSYVFEDFKRDLTQSIEQQFTSLNIMQQSDEPEDYNEYNTNFQEQIDYIKSTMEDFIDSQSDNNTASVSEITILKNRVDTFINADEISELHEQVADFTYQNSNNSRVHELEIRIMKLEQLIETLTC